MPNLDTVHELLFSAATCLCECERLLVKARRAKKPKKRVDLLFDLECTAQRAATFTASAHDLVHEIVEMEE